MSVRAPAPAVARSAPSRSWLDAGQADRRRSRSVPSGSRPMIAERGQRLARAGLTDQPDPLALRGCRSTSSTSCDRRRPRSGSDREHAVGQVSSPELGLGECSHRRSSSFGSKRSRSPSPSRLKPSTAIAIATPGTTASRGAREQQLLALLQHPAPGRGGRRRAEAEERQRSLGEHRDRERRRSAWTITRLADIRQHVPWPRSRTGRRPATRAASTYSRLHHLQRAAAGHPGEARDRGDPDGDHRGQRAARRRPRRT